MTSISPFVRTVLFCVLICFFFFNHKVIMEKLKTFQTHWSFVLLALCTCIYLYIWFVFLFFSSLVFCQVMVFVHVILSSSTNQELKAVHVLHSWIIFWSPATRTRKWNNFQLGVSACNNFRPFGSHFCISATFPELEKINASGSLVFFFPNTRDIYVCFITCHCT